MIRKGFIMQLYPGMEAEYKRRHDQLWQEMVEVIHQHGGRNYSIFLDRKTNQLYGYIEIEDEVLWKTVGEEAITKKWWAFMADIMETHPDNSPITFDLIEVFHLD